MKLSEFIPYRMAVVTELVSQSIAQVYRDRFQLTRDEWRVLAALVDSPEVHTKVAGKVTTLEKMPVSRAVKRLSDVGLLERLEDPADRRNKILKLTPRGRTLMAKLVPMALARENYLLEVFDDHERDQLHGLLDKLEQRARLLADQG